MGRNMTFDFGLNPNQDDCLKFKFRWLFMIPGISADDRDGVRSLPPEKSARPNLTFKEIEVEHLTETIYFPGKPEWKTLTLTLFDLKRNNHPIMDWANTIYNAREQSRWQYPGDNDFKKRARLVLFDGCGNEIEKWVFENVYPQDIAFGELDMKSSEYVTVDITLRYDRAWMEP